MILGVAGMIGCGKSTLSTALAKRFGLQLALESVDAENPWLELFYDGDAGMRAYGLHLQLHFLATRFQSMRRMRAMGGSWVLDRTWYEDAEIFARGLYENGYMHSNDWELYQRLYAELLHAPAARPPRLMVYLHGPFETILDRIHTRGRPKEKDTDPEYFRTLHSRYARWIDGFTRCPVLRLDIREYDLLNDPNAVDDIATRVRLELEKEIPQTELWPALKRRKEASPLG